MVIKQDISHKYFSCENYLDGIKKPLLKELINVY